MYYGCSMNCILIIQNTKTKWTHTQMYFWTSKLSAQIFHQFEIIDSSTRLCFQNGWKLFRNFPKVALLVIFVLSNCVIKSQTFHAILNVYKWVWLLTHLDNKDIYFDKLTSGLIVTPSRTFFEPPSVPHTPPNNFSVLPIGRCPAHSWVEACDWPSALPIIGERRGEDEAKVHVSSVTFKEIIVHATASWELPLAWFLSRSCSQLFFRHHFQRVKVRWITRIFCLLIVCGGKSSWSHCQRSPVVAFFTLLGMGGKDTKKKKTCINHFILS